MASPLPQTGGLLSALRSSAGRCFVGPLFDSLLIGGGLSLLVVPLLLVDRDLPGLGALASRLDALTGPEALPYAILLIPGAHFAASTVRLYTKPGTSTSLPFLTMGFPLVVFAVLTLCLLWPQQLGRSFQSLYLTWSPYHYAAQAYGLTVMYSMRSGCSLGPRDKRLLYWGAMLPFLYSFFSTVGAGFSWLVPGWAYHSAPVQGGLGVLRPALAVAGFAAPFALYAWLRRGGRSPMPWIGGVLLLSNAIWWYVLPPLRAFVWATIFHGIQYLAITMIFHVRQQVARPENRRGPLYHVVWFYTVCLALAYGMFNCLPQAYVLAGFSLSESLLLVAAAINIHHFIVDAYIWRLAPRDSNRTVVDSGGALAPAVGT